jgi:AcrR family transcriptional regulator
MSDRAVEAPANDGADGAADEAELRAVDGRVPGRRGRATRQRLLDCTASMLRTTSYRDLKVIEIAREAGTSPATFYQYFGDVEAAILVLGEEMVQDSEALVQLLAEGDWEGEAGYEKAQAFADAFMAFWDAHRAVLRVVDLSTGEGDRRFRSLRVTWLNHITKELARATEEFQARGRNLGVDPTANAGVLVAMVAQVAAHHRGFEHWGIALPDVRVAMARQIYWGVTGQDPPVS